MQMSSSQGSKRPGRNYGKLIVVGAVIAASAILLYVATTSLGSPSFPSEQKPFSEYATVMSSTFNGTEYNFQLQWRAAGNYTPLFAQMTSTSSYEDSAVCDVGISSISRGETLNLPFVLPENATTLSGVGLTIQFQAGNATAISGDIAPSSYACFTPSEEM
jgi:hypothetical protein